MRIHHIGFHFREKNEEFINVKLNRTYINIIIYQWIIVQFMLYISLYIVSVLVYV